MAGTRSPADKRKMCPGQEEAALWSGIKPTKDKVQGEGLLALPLLARSKASAEGVWCWGQALAAFPHRQGSWKEDSERAQ